MRGGATSGSRRRRPSRPVRVLRGADPPGGTAGGDLLLDRGGPRLLRGGLRLGRRLRDLRRVRSRPRLALAGGLASTAAARGARRRVARIGLGVVALIGQRFGRRIGRVGIDLDGGPIARSLGGDGRLLPAAPPTAPAASLRRRPARARRRRVRRRRSTRGRPERRAHRRGRRMRLRSSDDSVPGRRRRPTALLRRPALRRTSFASAGVLVGLSRLPTSPAPPRRGVLVGRVGPRSVRTAGPAARSPASSPAAAATAALDAGGAAGSAWSPVAPALGDPSPVGRVCGSALGSFAPVTAVLSLDTWVSRSTRGSLRSLRGGPRRTGMDRCAGERDRVRRHDGAPAPRVRPSAGRMPCIRFGPSGAASSRGVPFFGPLGAGAPPSTPR